MEAIGRLAGGIAHDFNNLLQASLSHAQMLRTHADDPERVRTEAAELEQHALRGAGLTRQLLLFSRREARDARTSRPERRRADGRNHAPPAGAGERRLRPCARGRAGDGGGGSRPARAGADEPGRQRLRRYAERRSPDHSHRLRPPRALPGSRSRTPATASRSRSASTSSSRSSPPRNRAREPDSACPSCTGSSPGTAAGWSWKRTRARDRSCASCCLGPGRAARSLREPPRRRRASWRSATVSGCWWSRTRKARARGSRRF